MKVYKLYVDVVDWDQYDSCVVVAESPEDALKTLEEHSELCYFSKRQGTIHVEEIDLNKKDIICASYNAG